MSNIITQGMPLQSQPVVGMNGCMTLPWYRFFLGIYNKVGLNTPGQTPFTGHAVSLLGTVIDGDTAIGFVKYRPGMPNPKFYLVNQGGSLYGYIDVTLVP